MIKSSPLLFMDEEVEAPREPDWPRITADEPEKQSEPSAPGCQGWRSLLASASSLCCLALVSGTATQEIMNSPGQLLPGRLPNS